MQVRLVQVHRSACERSTKATIIFQTVPPANATVLWGNTRLGRIKPQRPLVVVRPRDSGPLDVTIRAPGFLPVQTRAQTFGDTRLAVKLTRVDQKATLFGYRVPLDDAGVPLVTDGGVPDALSGMPSSLTQPSITPATQPPAPLPVPMSTPLLMSTPAPEQPPQRRRPRRRGEL